MRGWHGYIPITNEWDSAIGLPLVNQFRLLAYCKLSFSLRISIVVFLPLDFRAHSHMCTHVPHAKVSPEEWRSQILSWNVEPLQVFSCCSSCCSRQEVFSLANYGFFHPPVNFHTHSHVYPRSSPTHFLLHLCVLMHKFLWENDKSPICSSWQHYSCHTLDGDDVMVNTAASKGTIKHVSYYIPFTETYSTHQQLKAKTLYQPDQ